MSLAVEALLLLIEDAHPALHVVRTDAGLGVRALEAARDKLLADMLRERPEALEVTEATATITAAHFTGGYDFAGGVAPLHVEDVEIKDAQGFWRPVSRVGWDARFLTRAIPCVTIRRSVLWPLGQDVDYSGFTDWKVRYVPQQVALAVRGAGSSITVFPDHAKQFLASEAALRLARRMVETGGAPIDIGTMEIKRDEDFATFMNMVGMDSQAEVFMKRDMLE